MNMGYSCAFAWFCWATWVGDSFSPPTTKNSPVYGNIHGTRMCVFHVFSFLCFLFFHLCQVFSCFFHGFSLVLPQVFSHIRPGPSKSPSWPSWVLNESWTSEWGEGEVDDTICDLDLPRPGGGTVPIEWCVFTPWFWSFYHVLPSFTVFYFVLPVFGGSRWMMTNHQRDLKWGFERIGMRILNTNQLSHWGMLGLFSSSKADGSNFLSLGCLIST